MMGFHLGIVNLIMTKPVYYILNKSQGPLVHPGKGYTVGIVQFQDYFTHIETSQLVGRAKREYPGKTT